MQQQMRAIIQEVFPDLVEACGGEVDAETLADVIGDRMIDSSPEYRSLPYAQRRSIAVQVASEYA